MRCNRPRKYGYYNNPLAMIAVAFGVGVVLALCCSIRLILVIAAVCLISLGIACWR